MGPSSAFSLAFGMLLPASEKLEKTNVFIVIYVCFNASVDISLMDVYSHFRIFRALPAIS